ncbi:hypothetical protein B0H14DRAFT_3709373, partial [Mycena olivaceomarginata]
HDHRYTILCAAIPRDLWSSGQHQPFCPTTSGDWSDIRTAATPYPIFSRPSDIHVIRVFFHPLPTVYCCFTENTASHTACAVPATAHHTMGKKKTVLEEKELHALGIPFPDELDRCFRHPSDPVDDYASAYMRAVDFAAELGDTLAAHLWQQALQIGLRAGRGNLNAVASDAREEGMKQGREMGLSDGLKEGLSEGKRVGFVAGREFGEKHDEV